MNYSEFITALFQVVIIPCLGLLTGFFIKWINAKVSTLAQETDDTRKQKYLYMLQDTITQAVIAVNQTYVETLKQQGKFDKEAQAKAFTMVYNQVMLLLGNEGKKYLSEIVNDVNGYITMEIEAAVNNNKIKIE